MYKYCVNDWVQTIFGIGQIKKIWALNDKVTVFEIRHRREDKNKNVFYGEIIELLYRG